MLLIWEYAYFCRYFVSLSQVRYEHSYQISRYPFGVSAYFYAVGLEPEVRVRGAKGAPPVAGEAT